MRPGHVLDTFARLHVHGAVEAHHRKATLGQELVRHLLGRHEFGEHQHLEIRVAFLGLEAVDPVQERFGLGVRALGFAASCRFQEQLHLGPFIFQGLEPGLEQRVHLLLAVQVGPVLPPAEASAQAGEDGASIGLLSHRPNPCKALQLAQERVQLPVAAYPADSRICARCA